MSNNLLFVCENWYWFNQNFSKSVEFLFYNFIEFQSEQNDIQLWWYFLYSKVIQNTLYNVILCIVRNLLETRKNIKIKSHPFYHIICDWFSWGWSKKNFENWRFWKTAILNNRLKNNCLIPMKISHKLFGRMDGTQFWCFSWFPANFLLCVIYYTV